MNSQNSLTIDLSSIQSIEELHNLLATQLKFPAYYGNNWDAFWDCIVDPLQADMPGLLLLEGLERLVSRFPNNVATMLQCFNDYKAKNPEKEIFYKKRACPCCGYMTLEDPFPGSYEICPICFWEDDMVQFDDPDYSGGANGLPLRLAQLNFELFGACEKVAVKHVRKPKPMDVRDPSWKKVTNSNDRHSNHAESF